MLYDGLQKSLGAGERGLREQDYLLATESLAKARRIVTYMTNCLRPEGGEISENLRSLYAYCFDGIGRASLTKDPAILEDVQKIVADLAGAFHHIAREDSASAMSAAESE